MLLHVEELSLTDINSASGASPADTSTLVQNLLNSLGGNNNGSSSAGNREKLFCSLHDLLTPATCVPVIESASPAFLDTLLSNLPPAIILLETRPDDLGSAEPSPSAAAEALKSLTTDQKKRILRSVIRSPQLHQSLGSLTMAIRDGGLPNVAQALQINVENEGFIKGGSMPLGGGDAVEAFVEGVRRTVKEEGSGEGKGSTDTMDTS